MHKRLHNLTATGDQSQAEQITRIGSLTTLVWASTVCLLATGALLVSCANSPVSPNTQSDSSTICAFCNCANSGGVILKRTLFFVQRIFMILLEHRVLDVECFAIPPNRRAC